MPEFVAPAWWETPPIGFRWRIPPTRTGRTPELELYDAQYANIDGAFTALKAWIDEHGLSLVITRNFNRSFVTSSNDPALVSSPSISLPHRWLVYASVEEAENGGYSTWTPSAGGPTCPSCEESHGRYVTSCPTSGISLICYSCGRFNSDVQLIHDVGRTSCTNCAYQCVECETRISPGFSYCEEHSQGRGFCDRCGGQLEESAGNDEMIFFTTDRFNVCCQGCFEQCCPNCGDYSSHGLVFSHDLNGYVCRSCQRGAITGTGEEEYDASTDMAARALQLPSIPGREQIRLCGVEIEGVNGEVADNGQLLAATFFEAGLSNTNEVGGYHSGSSMGFAHVERDSTVSWESVIGPINMADRVEVQKLNRAIRAIRSFVRDGRYKLTLDCGTHIHVSADAVSLDAAYNLHSLFCFVEDVVYRLASAKWSVHRELAGNDHTAPLQKDLRNKVQFGRVHGDEDVGRYKALSFANYFNAMLNNCSCGAVRFDSWSECTCRLRKCTFEFRVFNATSNPRKLHAYLALCQALVAKALTIPAITDAETHYPAQEFLPKRFKDMGEPEQMEIVEEWRIRLEWLFNELPLTDEEKGSLIYCVNNSELASVGNEFIESLVPATEEVPA